MDIDMEWIYGIVAFLLFTIFLSLILNLKYNSISIYVIATFMRLLFHNYNSPIHLFILSLLILIIYFVKKSI